MSTKFDEIVLIHETMNAEQGHSYDPLKLLWQQGWIQTMQWESGIRMGCQVVKHIIYCIWETIPNGQEMKALVMLYNSVSLHL